MKLEFHEMAVVHAALAARVDRLLKETITSRGEAAQRAAEALVEAQALYAKVDDALAQEVDAALHQE